MRRLVLLAAVPALLIGAAPASSDTAPDRLVVCSNAGDDAQSLSKLLTEGQTFAFGCFYYGTRESLPFDKVTGTLTVSTATRRILGLKSRLIASGTLTGPKPYPANPNYVRYTLPGSAFPAAAKARLKAKHVALLGASPALEVTINGVVHQISTTRFGGKFKFVASGRTFRGCKTPLEDLWYDCKAGGLRP